MYSFIASIHVINCILLVVVVLLQSGKGGGLAGAFGGQGTQAVFGGRGAATFLSRATTVLAILFMITSLSMTVMGRSRGQRSILSEQAEQEGVAAPFVPEGAGGPPAGEAPPPGADVVPPGGDPATPAAGGSTPAPAAGAEQGEPAGTTPPAPNGGGN